MLKAYYLLLSNIILKSLSIFENVILSLARKKRNHWTAWKLHSTEVSCNFASGCQRGKAEKEWFKAFQGREEDKANTFLLPNEFFSNSNCGKLSEVVLEIWVMSCKSFHKPRTSCCSQWATCYLQLIRNKSFLVSKRTNMLNFFKKTWPFMWETRVSYQHFCKCLKWQYDLSIFHLPALRLCFVPCFFLPSSSIFYGISYLFFFFFFTVIIVKAM